MVVDREDKELQEKVSEERKIVPTTLDGFRWLPAKIDPAMLCPFCCILCKLGGELMDRVTTHEAEGRALFQNMLLGCMPVSMTSSGEMACCRPREVSLPSAECKALPNCRCLQHVHADPNMSCSLPLLGDIPSIAPS